jgi:hypothetical protein
MDLRDIAVAAGVISLWSMFVVLTVMGLKFMVTGRIRVTKTKVLSGCFATTIGMIVFLIGLALSVATWPPLLLH